MDVVRLLCKHGAVRPTRLAERPSGLPNAGVSCGPAGAVSFALGLAPPPTGRAGP